MAVGGKALPAWPDRRPDHLVPELDWVVGCTYEGMPVEQADVRNVMGCNMSMRRTVFDVAGTFDESIGRIGRVPLGCDETELCIRLGQTIPGARVVFVPEALVHHRVTEARTTWRYLRVPLLRRGAVQGPDRAADRQQRRHLGGARLRVPHPPRGHAQGARARPPRPGLRVAGGGRDRARAVDHRLGLPGGPGQRAAAAGERRRVMRILHLAQFYPPVVGGEERHVRNLAIELAGRGHEVHVACLDVGRPPQRTRA